MNLNPAGLPVAGGKLAPGLSHTPRRASFNSNLLRGFTHLTAAGQAGK